MKKLIVIAVILASSLFLTACPKKTVPEKVSDAVKSAGDSIEDAAKDTSKAIDDTAK